MDLTGARVLVTGATGGIGSATARLLRKRGVRLLLHGRDRDKLGHLSAELDAPSFAADLADLDAVETLALRAGSVDVLVHCAGFGAYCPVEKMGADVAERLVQANLTGPIELTRALLPGMCDRGVGHVAFVGSIAGLTGVAGEAVYSAAKAGLLTFADALQLELRDTGVTVSTLSPAAVDTGFWAERGAPYDRARPRIVPAHDVAALLVGDIERPRPRRITPRWLGLAVAARAVAPGMYRHLAERFA